MTAMEKIEKCGVVPVVVLDRAEDAVPTAEAMLRGGVNVMEITFRTARLRTRFAPWPRPARTCSWARAR